MASGRRKGWGGGSGGTGGRCSFTDWGNDQSIMVVAAMVDSAACARCQRLQRATWMHSVTDDCFFLCSGRTVWPSCHTLASAVLFHLGAVSFLPVVVFLYICIYLFIYLFFAGSGHWILASDQHSGRKNFVSRSPIAAIESESLNWIE